MSLLRERQGWASGIPRCARDDKEVLLAILRVSTVVIKQLLRIYGQISCSRCVDHAKRSKDGRGKAMKKRKRQINLIKSVFSFFPPDVRIGIFREPFFDQRRSLANPAAGSEGTQDE